jgi:hypothetical protein
VPGARRASNTTALSAPVLATVRSRARRRSRCR